MRSKARYVVLLAVAAVAAVVITACGTQKVQVPKANLSASTLGQYETGASIFRERCAGCHSLSYAGSDGSGQNPRDYLSISGPNFNQRCERPAIRVLYAIENGGFSGAYMPQNIVVGKQAQEVAEFVSEYAGRQAPIQPGAPNCEHESVGTLPAVAGSSSSGS